ncbi:hypothetical protein L1049_027827 [Liquidambar formosana]|uniref:Uncharacterized protein n=1 Tax=Liquidambar formosana TaxID=63359 RepID=A0AAP0RI08_LIQFO
MHHLSVGYAIQWVSICSDGLLHAANFKCTDHSSGFSDDGAEGFDDDFDKMADSSEDEKE